MGGSTDVMIVECTDRLNHFPDAYEHQADSSEARTTRIDGETIRCALMS